MKYKKGDRVPLIAFNRVNTNSHTHLNSQIDYLSGTYLSDFDPVMTSQEFRIITELFQNEVGEDTDEYYFAFSNPPNKQGKTSKLVKFDFRLISRLNSKVNARNYDYHLHNRPRKSLIRIFHLKIPLNGNHFGIILMDFESSTNRAMWIRNSPPLYLVFIKLFNKGG